MYLLVLDSRQTPARIVLQLFGELATDGIGLWHRSEWNSSDPSLQNVGTAVTGAHRDPLRKNFVGWAWRLMLACALFPAWISPS